MTTITQLPTPPSRDDPANFASRADAFLGALPTFVTQTNAVADETNQAKADTQLLKSDVQTLKAETEAIKAAAVADTTAIKDAAVADTTAIKNEAIAARDAAQTARLAAEGAANYIGIWAQLSGAKAPPASVYHNGKFWVLLESVTDITAHEPGVSSKWAKSSGGVETYSYDNRGSLRSTTSQTGDLALVEGLGLFRFVTGSDEPDDDESCFATATGRWLLEAAHWDVVDAWQLPDAEARDEWDEDEPLRFVSSFASRFASRVLHGNATCAITSVSPVSSASFTGTVTGAAVGDCVIATPPAQLGSDAANTGQLAFHAYVSAADTVTVVLTNASASTATTNTAIQTAWPVTVIKNV